MHEFSEYSTAAYAPPVAPSVTATCWPIYVRIQLLLQKALSVGKTCPLSCIVRRRLTSVTRVLLPHHSHTLPGGLGRECAVSTDNNLQL